MGVLTVILRPFSAKLNCTKEWPTGLTLATTKSIKTKTTTKTTKTTTTTKTKTRLITMGSKADYVEAVLS